MRRALVGVAASVVVLGHDFNGVVTREHDGYTASTHFENGVVVDAPRPSVTPHLRAVPTFSEMGKVKQDHIDHIVNQAPLEVVGVDYAAMRATEFIPGRVYRHKRHGLMQFVALNGMDRLLFSAGEGYHREIHIDDIAEMFRRKDQ